ncbi:MAG: alpha/beta hydrolase [Planctomycetota bacterium]|nr:alpha/beta hydrolase [Planctomycetota bacterium]
MLRRLWLVALLLVPFALRAEDAAVAWTRDVVFAEPGGEKLKLDLAKPAQGDGPFPIVVCIHGGAWRAGNKAGMREWLAALAAKGYAAALIDYRLAPASKFPAQIEDVKDAIRYLRAHAKDLKLDPERLATLGESAGGHLALLAGFTEAKDGLEGKPAADAPSTRVQAIVNFYGPTDFTSKTDWDAVRLAQAKDFLGTADQTAEVVKKASPITYLDAKDPPVLTIHGADDRVVPVDQAKHLHEALKKDGVKEKLVVLEGQGHGWRGETKTDTMRQAVEFLNEALKAAK